MRIWFRELRKEMNLSQLQLCKKLGCSQQLISKIEEGGDIRISTAKQIANKLNIDWKGFFED